MKVGQAVAEILKREGVEILCGYPVNHILEDAAAADIRPIIVRQERIGLHMADAISRVTSGRKIGVFCMQHGPGTENAYGGVAQAYGESVPMVVIPQGYPRRIANIAPNFNASLEMRGVTKWAEQVIVPAEIAERPAPRLQQLRNGRRGPAIVEIPTDIWDEEIGDLDYTPVSHVRVRARSGRCAQGGRGDPGGQAAGDLRRHGRALGRGLAAARKLAELLDAPVTTSLGGKSAFPENHPLSLGSGGNAMPKTVHHFLANADLIFGIGCSFTETNFGIKFPHGQEVHPRHARPERHQQGRASAIGLVGDAELTLDALIGELQADHQAQPRSRAPSWREITAGARGVAGAVDAEAQLERRAAQPVPRDLGPDARIDPKNTIITHDAGSPRDQLSPFWVSTEPLSYIGWGKTTQLGYGLGLAMGAKLAKPDKLCINVWGDAAIGFTGMDFETAVRERIPILSILLNNFSMAIELKVMPVSTEKYRSTDISGNYAGMARAFGGYGERVTEPGEIMPAIKRGIEQTQEGKPALLEFITAKETRVSKF